MTISISNTGILSSNTGLFDEIGQYMAFYDEANTTLYFDATGRFPYSTATAETWLNLAPNTKKIVANTTVLGTAGAGAYLANTYGPNAMIFDNNNTTAGRIDRTAASNTIICPAITSGTGKMTAAVWAYNTNWYQTTGQRFVSSTQGGGWSIALNDTGFTGTTSVGVVFYITGVGYRYMQANTIAAFTSSTGWNHLAWTFDGKYAYFYINGQVANTYTAAAATNDIVAGGCLAIGAESSGATTTTSPYLSGALASIFISNRSFTNTEIYNLFVDTDPNVNLPGSRTYVVNSTYSTATTIAPNVPARYYSNGALRTTGTIGFDEVSINSGSLFFNGSNQYLTLSGVPVAATGQFTVEAWIYTSTSAIQIIYSQYKNTNPNRNHFTIDNYTGYKLTFAHGTAATVVGNTVVPLNQWNHVAVTRDSSNTLRLFLNGVLDATQTSYTSSLGQDNPRVSGFNGVGTYNFNGYITNLRIANTALYTASFTPPKSSILEAVPNTSLLLQCTNSAYYIVDSSPNAFTITNNGGVAYNANSIFNYSPAGTVAAQKIYSDGTIAVSGYFDETQ
jgi:hypothetical protein